MPHWGHSHSSVRSPIHFPSVCLSAYLISLSLALSLSLHIFLSVAVYHLFLVLSTSSICLSLSPYLPLTNSINSQVDRGITQYVQGLLGKNNKNKTTTN